MPETLCLKNVPNVCEILKLFEIALNLFLEVSLDSR